MDAISTSHENAIYFSVVFTKPNAATQRNSTAHQKRGYYKPLLAQISAIIRSHSLCEIKSNSSTKTLTRRSIGKV